MNEPRMDGRVSLGGDSPDPPTTNSSEVSKTNSPSPDSEVKHVCGTYALISQCEHGHHFAKRIYCGKEWCPVCGAKRSPAHNRRISRVLPKAMQISSMGYFVIEFPDIYRHADIVYTKQGLKDTTRRIVDALAGKRMGNHGRMGGFFNRGLLRWHWYGDENPGKYNPHANVLVDSGYISPESLEEIKQALRQALEVPDLIVHYSFVDTPGQMFQKVEYITRATFLNYDWSPYMANQLFNFRNQRWWGKWNQEPVWGLDKVEDSNIDGLLAIGKLQAGKCPDCGCDLKTLYHAHDGHAVKWSRPIDSTWLVIWGAEEIAGTGYYRIPVQDWRGDSLSPEEFMRLNVLEEEAKNKDSVDRRKQFKKHLAISVQRRLERIKALNDSESYWDDLLEHPERHN